MSNISPCCDHGAEDDESEGKEDHGGYGSTEPQYFSISDYDDCEVFEDGVDRNGEEANRFRASPDHTDKP